MSVKATLRIALGLLWLYEGAVLKLAAPSPLIVSIVHDSGVYWPTPESAVVVLGLVQIAFGVWLVSGWRESLAAVTTTLFMCGLVGAAVLLRPSALIDPYGGIPKDVVLLAAAFGVWRLAGQGEGA